jgi:hypothetical protein
MHIWVEVMGQGRRGATCGPPQLRSKSGMQSRCTAAQDQAAEVVGGRWPWLHIPAHVGRQARQSCSHVLMPHIHAFCSRARHNSPHLWPTFPSSVTHPCLTLFCTEAAGTAGPLPTAGLISNTLACPRHPSDDLASPEAVLVYLPAVHVPSACQHPSRPAHVLCSNKRQRGGAEAAGVHIPAARTTH